MDLNKSEERSFHDRYVTSQAVRSFEGRFYCDFARQLEYEISFSFLGDLSNKKILFYGSGAHLSLIRKFVQLGAIVTAIDISPETITKVVGVIENEKMMERAAAVVMDCESLSFEDETFDIVFARSVIHHLDVEKSLAEIARVLKPNGKFSVLEPLGTNPLINFYRWLTPGSRTSGEHPLRSQDLKVFARHFNNVKTRYLYSMSILAYLYRIIDRDESRFNWLFKTLCRFDNFMVRRLPGYRFFCWDILICCEK